ncbi:hypothetical protein [Actinomadura monticuli]|uniref:Uncharacterized protein n=1 Tax=Actinomadura monticuli TaxID=3097367 RepID=A0ABV4Q6U8_9ACTN
MFEQPPCLDGHGGQCPERACVECGTAVLVGLPPVTAPARETGSESVPAPGQSVGRAVTVRAVA